MTYLAKCIQENSSVKISVEISRPWRRIPLHVREHEVLILLRSTVKQKNSSFFVISLVIYGTYVTLCLSQRSKRSSCSLRSKYGDNLPGINQGLAQPCAKSRALNDRCDRCERCQTHRMHLKRHVKTPCQGTCCRWSCLQTAGHHDPPQRTPQMGLFSLRCEMWDARWARENAMDFRPPNKILTLGSPEEVVAVGPCKKLHAGDIYKQKLLWNHSQRLYCSLGTPRQIKETQGLKATRLEMPNHWIRFKARIFHFCGYNSIQTTLQKTFRTFKS